MSRDEKSAIELNDLKKTQPKVNSCSFSILQFFIFTCLYLNQQKNHRNQDDHPKQKMDLLLFFM